MNRMWYEVWADDALPLPYLLVVTPGQGDLGVVIIDPRQDDQLVHEAKDYDSAKLWLLEDEYTLVRGRMVPDQEG